jgi:D-alanyl-D-alanine carboxypeptidase
MKSGVQGNLELQDVACRRRARGRRSPHLLPSSVLALSVACLIGCGDGTHTLDPASRATLEAAFEQGFARSGAAGARVGVWIPGRGSWVASHGVADRRTGEPMRRPMQAPIGSVTKTYTVLVALQLVGEGVLGLDDTVDRWYPTYPESGAITLRMLMNHSSGIADISVPQIEIKCRDPHEVVDPDRLIEISATLPRAPFAPGRGSQYSSANTIILGRIMEMVTQTSYATLLASRLFEPLGLTRTRLDADGKLETPYVHGYTGFCDPILPKGTDTSSWTMIAFSGGALASTIDDLHAYGVAFGEGYGLSDALKQARIDDTAPTDDSSGLGLVVQRDPSTGEVISIGHAGSEPGYGTSLVYYPCTGAVFAAMSNVDFDPAFIEILRALQPVVQDLATERCSSSERPPI